MNIPDNVLNPSLYRQAKKDADEKFKRPTSAYKSMYISKRYKELGGKYSGQKKSLTSRWLKEEWVQVIPYVRDGKKISCGSDNRKNKVCRPLLRVDKQTPITIAELRKKYTDKEILTLANKKIRDMKGRLMWKSGKFISSK
jgi:hypothetical protein